MAIVCITNLATQKWQLVWAVTGVVGLIVMGTPQLTEWIGRWQERKALKARADAKAAALAPSPPSLSAP